MAKHEGLTARLVTRLVLAEVCPACRGPTTGGFCRGCASEFRRIARPCRICGLEPPVGRCPRLDGWRIARTHAPFAYTHPLDRHLQALKFGRARALGRAFGLLLAAALADPSDGERLDADALVPVPLHPRRWRARGYNQAIEIGRTVASALGLELIVGGVCKPRETAPQAGLDAAARRTNVAGAFRVDRDLKGRRVAIVDDVITTGATVDALAAALAGAGAAAVVALAVARTARPGQGAAPAATGALRNT